MILQRLAENLKRRDWGAAAIEILIVVVGIFIGLQVDDWNNARKDRIAEQEYLQRLYDDIDRLVVLQAERLAHRARILGELGDVADKLLGVSTAPWSESDCDALTLSHIFSPLQTEVPVLNEMLATGAVGLIQDTGIRDALSALQIQVSRSEEMIARLDGSMMILSRVYPEAIWEVVAVVEDDPENRHEDQAYCDFEFVRTSRALQSDFADNYSRYRAYVNTGLRDTHEQFRQLHALLASTLDLAHS